MQYSALTHSMLVAM